MLFYAALDAFVAVPGVSAAIVSYLMPPCPGPLPHPRSWVHRRDWMFSNGSDVLRTVGDERLAAGYAWERDRRHREAYHHGRWNELDGLWPGFYFGLWPEGISPHLRRAVGILSAELRGLKGSTLGGVAAHNVRLLCVALNLQNGDVARAIDYIVLGEKEYGPTSAFVYSQMCKEIRYSPTLTKKQMRRARHRFRGWWEEKLNTNAENICGSTRR